MDRKRKKAYKKRIKLLKKFIRNWEHWLNYYYETRLPYLRAHIRAYKKELKNLPVIIEFLSEYYGKLEETKSDFEKEKLNE